MVKCLKERLQEGETLVGCFVMIPSADVVEMLAYAGFDFVVIDTEHGPAGGEILVNQLRAANASGISALVRTVGTTPGEILRAMDAGSEGIVVPHVRTEADARGIASAAHYPPNGIRGLATTARAGRHGFVNVHDHLANAARQTLVIPQIEDADALPNVPAIARVPGVDAVFIGPADLSLSLGHPGNPGHPDVVKAIEDTARHVREAGRIAMSFARNKDDVATMKERGITVPVFSSTSIIAAAFQDALKALKA